MCSGTSLFIPCSSDTIFQNKLPEKNSSSNQFTSSSDHNIPSQDNWNLVLVNRWNPLQNDSEMELTTLSNGKQIDSRIYPSLQEMFDDMREEGVYPVVASGYRTKVDRERIYNEKIESYQAEGLSYEEAKKETENWVALPGTSEHQLGLAVDINADGVHSAGYEVYDWLERNACRYGFIKRYPEDKTEITGVSNEPWHYRYVGKTAAKEIYEQGICLEEYLGKTNG